MTKLKKLTEEEVQLLQRDLEDLEEYVREFSSFLPVSVCNVNPLGIIIDVNRSFEEITGYRLVEIVGEPLGVVFLEKDEVRKIQKEIQTRESIRKEELTLVTKNKKEIPVSVWISQRKDQEGHYIGCFVGIIDISEFKALKQTLEDRVRERTAELEESARELADSRKALINILEDVELGRVEAEVERDRTAAIIENFADGLLVIERQKITLVNSKAKEQLGLDEKEIVGQGILELEDNPKIGRLVKLLEAKDLSVFREELELKKKGLVLEVSTTPVLRGEGQIGTIVILHDITREKAIERMKTEFVSITAHQLRTPLSAIKWILRMLLDGDLGPISETQQDFLEKTYRSNERMIRIINDLLNVTRIEEGRFLSNLKKEDILAITERVIAPLGEAARRKKLSFEFKKPSGKPPKASIDAEKLTFVLQNLLDNAIHYTKAGKVEVSLEYSPAKREFLFKIKDTGIGISGDQQKRVFSRFFRAANAIKAETEGTGLGLFIAKNIIESHGGRIWFESVENKGSTFYFTLPVGAKEEFEKFIEEF